MLISETEQYIKAAFDDEVEIEGVVRRFADLLFGPNSIYLSQARISTLGGFGTVPDAVVIDVESEEWYVVEAERRHTARGNTSPRRFRDSSLPFQETRRGRPWLSSLFVS